jgi:hypothetical protein
MPSNAHGKKNTKQLPEVIFKITFKVKWMIIVGSVHDGIIGWWNTEHVLEGLRLFENALRHTKQNIFDLLAESAFNNRAKSISMYQYYNILAVISRVPSVRNLPSFLRREGRHRYCRASSGIRRPDSLKIVATRRGRSWHRRGCPRLVPQTVKNSHLLERIASTHPRV